MRIHCGDTDKVHLTCGEPTDLVFRTHEAKFCSCTTIVVESCLTRVLALHLKLAVNGCEVVHNKSVRHVVIGRHNGNAFTRQKLTRDVIISCNRRRHIVQRVIIVVEKCDGLDTGSAQLLVSRHGGVTKRAVCGTTLEGSIGVPLDLEMCDRATAVEGRSTNLNKDLGIRSHENVRLVPLSL